MGKRLILICTILFLTLNWTVSASANLVEVGPFNGSIDTTINHANHGAILDSNVHKDIDDLLAWNVCFGTDTTTAVGNADHEDHANNSDIVYWQDENLWIGYLQDYPDYMTQGETFEELQDNLKDIYDDIVTERIPFIRKVGELVIA